MAGIQKREALLKSRGREMMKSLRENETSHRKRIGKTRKVRKRVKRRSRWEGKHFGQGKNVGPIPRGKGP